MKKLLALLVFCVVLCSMTVSAFGADLQFNASGNFKILLIADPQDDEDPQADTANLIRLSIAETKPDFIVCLGDMVEDSDVKYAPERDKDGNRVLLPYAQIVQNSRVALSYIFAPIIESGIPYTTVIGNNDYQSDVTATDWYKLLSELPGIILPEKTVNSENRVDNMLAVKDTDGKDVLRIFTMDSGKKGVTNEQIKWFEKANDDRSIPCLVFQHIPMDEVGGLFQTCFPWDEGAAKEDGRYLRINTEIASGNANGEALVVGSTKQFRSIRKCGNIIGVYSGHVHNITIDGTYRGVRMGLVYSDRWNGNYRHGAALLTLNKNDLKHYTFTAYRYTGSAEGKDAAVEVEESVSYPTYTGLAYIRYEWNLMTNYLQEKIDSIFHK